MAKVIFQHLAKTAGTSLIKAVEKAFPEQVCSARYDGELTPDLIQDKRFAFYHGHFSFEKVEEFKAANAEAFAFVFLRHPINRVISQYHNWVDAARTRTEYAAIKERGAMPEEMIAEKLTKFEETIFSLSLPEFLASADPDILDVVYNHQTRYLCRRAIFTENPLLGCVNAIENLFAFYDFVGLLETYDESVRELSKRLEIDTSVLRMDVRVNTNDLQKTRGRYRADRDTILALVDKNTYDLALFHFVLGRHGIPTGLDIADMLALPEML